MSDGTLSFQGMAQQICVAKQHPDHDDGQPFNLPMSNVGHTVFDTTILRATENIAGTEHIACDLPSR